MADIVRINIEPQFWADVGEVAAKISDYDKAVAQALRLIKFGVERFKQERAITYAEFKEKFSIGDALIPEFARRDGEFIIVVGSKRHFGWLTTKSEAGAMGGKVSAKRPRDKKGRLKPKQDPSKVQAPSKQESEAKQTQASLSSSSSDSSSSSASSISTVSEKPKAVAFIVGYKARFKERWNAAVNVEGKDAGIAKRVAERLSYEEIELFLDAFFSMPDAELVKKRHPIFLFEVKINEISVFAQTGNFTTQREAAQADNSVAMSSQLRRIREGKL